MFMHLEKFANHPPELAFNLFDQAIHTIANGIEQQKTLYRFVLVKRNKFPKRYSAIHFAKTIRNCLSNSNKKKDLISFQKRSLHFNYTWSIFIHCNVCNNSHFFPPSIQ